MQSWEWITLGIDASIVALFYALYKSNNSKAQQIQDAVQLNIDKDLATLVLRDGASVEYGCIQGSVGADSHLNSRFCNDTGVIRQFSDIEHKSRRENGMWRDVRNVITDAVDKIPFYLRNSDKEYKVYINEPLDAEYLMDELKVTHSNFKPTEQSASRRVVDRLFGDVTKGFQESEEMLPIGTCLLGLGRITVENGKMILEPPTNGSLYILTTKTRKELLKAVSRTSKVLKTVVVIFGVLGAGFFTYILYRKFKSYFENRREGNMFARLREQMRNRFGRNRQVADNGELGQEGGANDEDFVEGRDCVICLTKQRDIVLLDCGHICVCVDCAQALPVPRRCPVCRSHVVRIVPLYNS